MTTFSFKKTCRVKSLGKKTKRACTTIREVRVGKCKIFRIQSTHKKKQYSIVARRQQKQQKALFSAFVAAANSNQKSAGIKYYCYFIISEV